MLKKIMLSAVICCTAVMVCASFRIDQSTPSNLKKSLLYTFCSNDLNAFKSLMATDASRKTFEMKLQFHGISEQQFFNFLCNAFFKQYKISNASELLNDNAKFNQIANKALSDNDILFIDGKYGILFPMVSHNDKKDVAIALLLALTNNDACSLFSLYPPSVRKMQIAKYGSREKAIAELHKVLVNGKSIKISVADLKNKELIDGAMQLLTQVDGKWYLDTTK